MSSLRIAQAYAPLTVTALKVPEGGSASPSLLEPQQARVSSLRIAQAFDQPAARALKRPLGASVSPFLLGPPQQVMVSLLRIAQEKSVPVATDL